MHFYKRNVFIYKEKLNKHTSPWQPFFYFGYQQREVCLKVTVKTQILKTHIYCTKQQFLDYFFYSAIKRKVFKNMPLYMSYLTILKVDVEKQQSFFYEHWDLHKKEKYSGKFNNKGIIINTISFTQDS